MSLAVDDQLVSLFDAPTTGYPEGSTLPRVTQFVSDNGLDKQQQLPADTATLTVSGDVGGWKGHPLVRGDGWLALPDDSVEYVPVTLEGETFSATFMFKQGPGRYQVEINDTAGSAIINVPLFLGAAYAPDPPIWPAARMPSAAESALQAFDGLNTLREAHGLPDVVLDPRLRAIAEDHVADLVAHGWYCHCWADGTTVFDHARDAGIKVVLRLARTGSPGMQEYAIGEGFSTLQGSQAIDGLWTSPARRFDELGSWTHVGVAANVSENNCDTNRSSPSAAPGVHGPPVVTAQPGAFLLRQKRRCTAPLTRACSQFPTRVDRLRLLAVNAPPSGRPHAPLSNRFACRDRLFEAGAPPPHPRPNLNCPACHRLWLATAGAVGLV